MLGSASYRGSRGSEACKTDPARAAIATVSADAPAMLTFPGAPFVVIDPAGPPRVLIHSRGYDSIQVRIHRVRPEDYEFSVQLSQAYELIIKLEIVGTDAQVDDWGEVIVKAGRKGKAGDGMVPVDQAVRVRTGERGEAS